MWSKSGANISYLVLGRCLTSDESFCIELPLIITKEVLELVLDLMLSALEACALTLTAVQPHLPRNNLFTIGHLRRLEGSQISFSQDQMKTGHKNSDSKFTSFGSVRSLFSLFSFVFVPTYVLSFVASLISAPTFVTVANQLSSFTIYVCLSMFLEGPFRGQCHK